MSKQRAWVRIAVVAIACAIVLSLALAVAASGVSGHAADFAAIVPLLLVGILSPLTLLGTLAFLYAGRIPQAPQLAFAFQRPPPFRRG